MGGCWLDEAYLLAVVGFWGSLQVLGVGFFLKKNDDDDDEELEGKEMRRKAAVLLTKGANTNADVN